MTVREYIEENKADLGEYHIDMRDIFGQGSSYFGGGAEQALSEHSSSLESNFIRACEIKKGTMEIIYMKSLDNYDMNRLLRETEVLRDNRR